MGFPTFEIGCGADDIQVMRVGGGNILMGGVAGSFDGHAHVFDMRLKMIEGRRYTPRGDARFGDLCAHLKTHGLAGVILVQPSFLRYDNTHLLTSLGLQAAGAQTGPSG